MKNCSLLFISWTDLCTLPPSHKTIQISFELFCIERKILELKCKTYITNKIPVKERGCFENFLSSCNEPWAGIASLHSLHFAVVVDMANLKEMLVLTATYLTRELYWYIYLVKESKVFNSMSNKITILQMEHNVRYCEFLTQLYKKIV